MLSPFTLAQCLGCGWILEIPNQELTKFLMELTPKHYFIRDDILYPKKEEGIKQKIPISFYCCPTCRYKKLQPTRISGIRNVYPSFYGKLRHYKAALFKKWVGIHKLDKKHAYSINTFGFWSQYGTAEELEKRYESDVSKHNLSILKEKTKIDLFLKDYLINYDFETFLCQLNAIGLSKMEKNEIKMEDDERSIIQPKNLLSNTTRAGVSFLREGRMFARLATLEEAAREVEETQEESYSNNNEDDEEYSDDSL